MNNEDVQRLASQLTKAFDENHEETIVDILNVLTHVKMTVELLKATMVGKTLTQVKKKYTNSSQIQSKAQHLLGMWKELAGVATSSAADSKPKPTFSNTVSKDSAEKEAPKSVSKVENEIDGDGDDMDFGKHLPEIRKKIVEAIAKELQTSTTIPSIALSFAYNIEDSIHRRHPESIDGDNYKKKARSIVSNFKKNEGLRKAILDGSQNASKVVDLTIEQLASQERNEERNKDIKEISLSQRTDFMDITRAERMLANGIDPNMGGEFTCRRCKGNKTTHYERQTRSSDEPMTVFVTCLTCGNRWKC